MSKRAPLPWLARQNWRTTDQHTYYILARTGEILAAQTPELMTQAGDRLKTQDGDVLLVKPDKRFVRR